MHIVQGKFKGNIIRIEAWGENIFAKSSMSKEYVCGKIDGLSEIINQSDLGEIVNVGGISSCIALLYENKSCLRHHSYYNKFIEIICACPSTIEEDNQS